MKMPVRSFGQAAAVVVVLCGLAVAPAVRADLIYDATGGTENGGDPVSAAGPILADRFVSTVDGKLGSVTLNLMLNGTLAGAGLTVDLFADNGAAGPGKAILIANVNEGILSSSSFSLITYNPTSTISLIAGQSYYIGVLDSLATSNAILGNTLDVAVLGRAPVVDGASYYNNGGVQANAGGPYEIRVNAIRAVPEAASLALMLVGLVSLGTKHAVRLVRKGVKASSNQASL